MMQNIFIPITQLKKHFLLSFCFLSVVITNAQFNIYNLVPNPSFEQYTNCPYYLSNQYSDKPDNWYKPDRRGARYFNACANGYDNNYNGMPVNWGAGGENYQLAKTGNAYMVLFFIMV
jgi:hypothetical protein